MGPPVMDSLRSMESASTSVVKSTPAPKRSQWVLVRRLLTLTTVLAIVATACGNGASTTEATAPTGDVAAQSSDPGANAFLEGEFETFGGESINLADVQNKDAVFWFWAPW